MTEPSRPWWKNRLVIVQTNLQAADTSKINPERLVQQICELDADALLFNVGGIYAWYPSAVPCHHINEFLPQDRDLLQEVIDACHAAGLRFIARYDFSLAHDDVYALYPEWFTQTPQRESTLAGEKRPGPWDLLYATCINSPYCGDAVAVPVLQESLRRYDIDGVFFNWPHPRDCWCDHCRRLYRARYGVAMPEEARELAPDWHSYLYRENTLLLHKAIQEARPGTPLVLYSEERPLVENAHPAEIICAETRDSLSEELADVWMPQVSMKHIESYKTEDAPVWGFVHSAPGLDWRHVGIPEAEYDFWLSQIVSGGWTLVHSVTGIPDTIYDKRILGCVERANRCAHKIFPALEGTRPFAQIAVLWDHFHPSKGWMDILADSQRPFVLLERDTLTLAHMAEYPVVIVPREFSLTEPVLLELEAYVSGGGCLLYEGDMPDHLDMLYDILGLQRYQHHSKALAAAYWRFEEDGAALAQGGLENTPLVGVRGEVVYSRVGEAQTLATLVPPFVDPPQLAGKPPERASIRVAHTQLPLCTLHSYGKGKAAALMVSLPTLYHEIGMVEHLLLCDNLLGILLPAPKLKVTRKQGLYVMCHGTEKTLVVQLLNGAGARPLHHRTPLLDIEIRVQLPGCKRVQTLLENQEFSVEQDASSAAIRLSRLDAWEALVIQGE